MILTPHAAVGALAGSRAGVWPVALGVGVGTHVVLDWIPHADYAPTALFGLVLLADLLVALAITLRVAASADRLLVLAGSFGGVVPDAVQALEKALGIDVTLSAHQANHVDVVWPVWAGSLTQGATLGVAVLIFQRWRAGQKTPPNLHKS